MPSSRRTSRRRPRLRNLGNRAQEQGEQQEQEQPQEQEQQQQQPSVLGEPSTSSASEPDVPGLSLTVPVPCQMQRAKDAQILSKNKYQEFDLRQQLVRAVVGYGMNTPWLLKRKQVLTMYTYQLEDKQDTRDERATFYCRLMWLHLDENKFQTQAVVLTPTRKLAKYLYEIFQEILFNSNVISVRLCTGDTPLVEQLEKIHTCCIVIGTPDRIFDLISCRVMWLSDLKIFLYDEDEDTISTSFKHKIDLCLGTVSCDVRNFK